MMKKYLLLFLPLFLISFKGFSQQTPTQSQSRAYLEKPKFPGGDEAFKKEFMNMVYAYLDMALYTIQGEVTFIFNIDAKGKIDKIDVLPKFKDHEMFTDDIRYAVKKVKGKWSPATANGIPVDSKLMMKVQFNNNTYDHD